MPLGQGPKPLLKIERSLGQYGCCIVTDTDIRLQGADRGPDAVVAWLASHCATTYAQQEIVCLGPGDFVAALARTKVTLPDGGPLWYNERVAQLKNAQGVHRRMNDHMVDDKKRVPRFLRVGFA